MNTKLVGQTLVIKNGPDVTSFEVSFKSKPSEVVGRNSFPASSSTASTTVDLKKIEWWIPLEAGRPYNCIVSAMDTAEGAIGTETLDVSFTKQFVEDVNFSLLPPASQRQELIQSFDQKIDQRISELSSAQAKEKLAQENRTDQKLEKFQKTFEDLKEELAKQKAAAPSAPAESAPAEAKAKTAPAGGTASTSKAPAKTPTKTSVVQKSWWRRPLQMPRLRKSHIMWLIALIVGTVLAIVFFSLLFDQGCRSKVNKTATKLKEEIKSTPEGLRTMVHSSEVKNENDSPTRQSVIKHGELGDAKIQSGALMKRRAELKAQSRATNGSASIKRLPDVSGNGNIVITGDVFGDLNINSPIPTQPRPALMPQAEVHIFDQSGQSGANTTGTGMYDPWPNVEPTAVFFLRSSVDEIRLPNDLLYPGQVVKITKDAKVNLNIRCLEGEKVDVAHDGQPILSDKDKKRKANEIMLRIKPGITTPTRITFYVKDD